MSPDDAWDELNAALRHYAPPCVGDAMFTADRLSAEDRARCAAICGRCLVSDLCDAAATAAKVTSGFWAGHQYSERSKTTAPGGSRQPINRRNTS